jgi:hypothetical protein
MHPFRAPSPRRGSSNHYPNNDAPIPSGIQDEDEVYYETLSGGSNLEDSAEFERTPLYQSILDLNKRDPQQEIVAKNVSMFEKDSDRLQFYQTIMLTTMIINLVLNLTVVVLFTTTFLDLGRKLGMAASIIALFSICMQIIILTIYVCFKLHSVYVQRTLGNSVIRDAFDRFLKHAALQAHPYIYFTKSCLYDFRDTRNVRDFASFLVLQLSCIPVGVFLCWGVISLDEISHSEVVSALEGDPIYGSLRHNPRP